MNNIDKIKDRKTRNKLSIYELCQIISQITKYLENRTSISELINDENASINEIINPASLAVKLFKQNALNIYIERKEEVVPLSDFIINPYDLEWVEKYYLEQDQRLKNLDKENFAPSEWRNVKIRDKYLQSEEYPKKSAINIVDSLMDKVDEEED